MIFRREEGVGMAMWRAGSAQANASIAINRRHERSERKNKKGRSGGRQGKACALPEHASLQLSLPRKLPVLLSTPIPVLPAPSPSSFQPLSPALISDPLSTMTAALPPVSSFALPFQAPPLNHTSRPTPPRHPPGVLLASSSQPLAMRISLRIQLCFPALPLPTLAPPSSPP